MKYFFSTIFLFLVLNEMSAQIKGIDENGHALLLYSNGTWRYDVDSARTSKIDSIPYNEKRLVKSSENNFLIKSNVLNVGVYFNTSKWTVKPHLDNEVIPEYRFSFKSTDAFAMLITEKTTIDISQMRDIALLNAQKAAPDAQIVFNEYRNVNGNKVLCLKFTGTSKGIKFEYYGYYYSNENGTVQLIAFTSQQLFESLSKELEEFLNGLVEVKP